MKVLNKILIFLVMLMTLAVSGFSVTQITSCSNPVWTNNEVYLINLTDNTISAGAEPCININVDIENVTFQQVNDVIYLENTLANGWDFFHWTSPNIVNVTFTDFNIINNNDDGNNRGGFLARANTISDFLRDVKVENSYFENFRYIYGLNALDINADEIFFTNSQAIKTEWIVNYRRLVTQTPIYSDIDLYLNGSIHFSDFTELADNMGSNPYIILGAVGGFNPAGTGTQVSQYSLHYEDFASNTLCRKVNTLGNNVAPSECFLSTIDNVIIRGTFDFDNDNDNQGDVTPGNAFAVTLFGTTYIRDMFEAFDIIGVQQDDAIFHQLADETISAGGGQIIGTGFKNEELRLDDVVVTMWDLPSINLQLGNRITCNSFDRKLYDNCILRNSDVSAVPFSADKFKGLIQLTSDNLIESATFDMTYYNWTNKQNTISNVFDGVLDNITIRFNDFYLADNQDTNFPTDTDIQSTIKLRGTNIEINNNNFFSYPGDLALSNYHNLIYLDSTNQDLNEITLNTFTSNGGALVSVLTNQCDATIYHNSLGGNVSLFKNCDTNPIINKKVGYLHIDNNVYYFTLGNYYEDYTGCVDVNADGKCDSAYVTGDFTDSNALASYPFDFSAHLIDAESSTPADENFVVNVTYPTENLSIEVAGLGSNIDVIYQHNSTFPDLTCDYIIDNSTILSARDYNVNSSLQTQGFTGWSEGTHTAKINCFNEFQSIDSLVRTFEVTYTGTGGGGNETPGNETNGGGLPGGTDYDVDGFDYIDLNDIDGTTDNIISSVSNVGAFIWNIGVPILIGFVVLGAILLVGVIIK